MLTTPGGRSAWRQTSAKRRALSGVVDAGLRTTVLPGGEGRGDLPGEHQEREVPRDDLGGDAERLGDAARERVLELVRPAGVVPEVGRRERHVDVARLLDRLAGVHRLEDGELARPLLEDPGDPEQVLRPLLAGQRAPRPAERASARPGPPCPCRRAVARATSASGSSVAGLTVVKVWPSRRGDVLAADEQPVALLERDDVARLGRRRVLPRDRRAVAEAPARRGAGRRGSRAPSAVRGVGAAGRSAGVFGSPSRPLWHSIPGRPAVGWAPPASRLDRRATPDQCPRKS